MTLVVIESPLKGTSKRIVARNRRYARACMRDSLDRGEHPFASHLLYTQEGILNDENPIERQRGIDAGLAWGEHAQRCCVYVDLGVTPGMVQGIARAKSQGIEIVTRMLVDWDDEKAPTGESVPPPDPPTV